MRDTLFFTKLRVFLGQWRRRAHRRTSWMKAQLRHLRRRARGLVRVSRGSSSQSSALNPQHSYASRYALEPLENRILLAADLTGVLVGATGLNPAVPGNTASAVVRVQNIGDNGLTNSELGVYASLDRTLDVSDLLLGTAKTGQMGTKQPIPIFEDTSKKDVRVNLELPSTLDRTFYYLLTKVDNTNTITENSETNNVSFSFFRDLNVVWQFGTVPGRTGNTTLTLRETDGTVVTFRLTGPGLGEVIKDGTNWDLNVTGTTASSAVTITTNSAGNGRVTLNDIHVVGPVGTFLAATTDLTGTLAIDGPVNIPGALPGTVTLRSVQGGTVAVPSVEALTILGPTTNAKFYIGAMLGQDGQPGGTGATADMYGQGKIGLFTVTGAMTNTTVRVGVDPVDGAYGNGNDTIVGGTNSSIGGITIGGSLSADTRFYAGKFPTQYFHGLTRKLTAGDPHFSTNPNGGSPANQPPMNTVPSVQTGNEDTALSIHGLSVTDVDGNLATTQLAVTNGTLTVDLAGGATISAGANGTNMLTVSGTQAQINAALATLRYRGTSNYNGPDTLIVTSTDSASAADVDTVAITVQPVNDAPSFVKGADQTAQEDAGLQTVVGWATNISAGPVNENGQSLTFDVTNDNTSLFSNQPAVAQDGTLTFTPAANAFGTALVTVMLRDDGGTANGGSDTSAAQTFSITVNPVADTVTWTGTAGDGLWNTAGNWDIGRIPDANDDVVINVPDTAIELGSGVTSVRNLTVTTELLELTSAAGGTLAVDGLASVRTLEIRQAAFRVGTLQGDALALSRNAQATVTGATDLTTLVQFRGSTATFDGVTEIFSVRVGGLAGTGGSPQLFPGTSDVVQFNGATQIHEALLLFAQGTLIGTGEVVLTGNQLRWLGGTMNGSGRTIVESGRTLEISSTTPVGLDRTLENRGTVLMRAGTEVTGTGNYGQTALGRLQVEIGGPTTFGRLGLSGAVSLAGELEVTLLNGFVPADGTRFQFLTNGTRTGSFATTALPSGLTLDTTDPADLEVVAIATNHVPVANAQSVTTPEDTSKTITLTGSDGDNDPLTFNIVTGPQHGTLTAVTPVPFTGLVSRWSAEGDAGDSIGPSFENGSLQNGAAIVTQGKVGQGFSFDGTNDHILVPAASALNVGLGSGFTISTWINPTDLSQSRPLVEWNKVGAPFEGVHVWIAGAGLGNGPGSLYANIKDSTGGNHIFSSAAGLLTTNMYQQATLTYDKTTGVGRMYLNGEQVTSANLGIFTPSTSSDLYFGLRPANGGAPGTWFSYAGRMDEVGIYNRALSAQDVDQLFKAENSLVGSNGQAATLNYTPEADYNGPDSFTFTVNDGTVDSAPGTVTIDATAVNDAPSFTKGADQTVQEDAGLQTVAGWATNISAGPVNESGQNLTFVVTNDNNALFSVQPAVAPDGTLTFTSASNVSGTATAMVVLRDNGGTSNGGVDTSVAQTFTITVMPITQTVSWINPAGGDWADGANWSTGSVPTATQDVVIDLAGTYTITHSTGTTQIKSLKSEHQINLTGGTLTVTKSVQMNGAVLSLAGGTLKNSTVTGTGVNDRVMEVLGSGTVDGITFENNDSAIHMYVSPGAQLTIVNGMTMNGGGLLVEDGHVVASSPPSGSQTIGGTSGGITLRRGDLTSPGATLILGQNIDILSERGSIGSVDGGIVLMGSTNVTGNGELNTVNVRNMGHIQVNGKAGPADVGGVLAGTGFFFNEGSIGAQNGSLLSFERFENSGAIRILHPGLNPVVTFTMTDTNPVYNLPTGTIEIWNDLTMNLIGSLYNEGRVFTGQEVAPDSRGVLNISGDVTVPNSGAGIWLHDGEMKVEGTLVNLGTVNLETGLLQVGDYVQEQGSSLSTNLASLTDFGRLAVDRVATLNGILAVAPTGALTPGDRYRFMTFGSRGNSFEDLQLPSNLVLDDTDPGFLELVVNA